MPSPPSNRTRFQIPNIKSLSDENLPSKTQQAPSSEPPQMNVKFSFEGGSPSRDKFLPSFASHDPPVGLVDTPTGSEAPTPASPASPSNASSQQHQQFASPLSPAYTSQYSPISPTSVELERVPDGFYGGPNSYQPPPPLPPSSKSTVSLQSLPSLTTLPSYDSLDLDDVERERNPDGFCSEALHVEPMRSSGHVPNLPQIPGSRRPASLIFPARASQEKASTSSQPVPNSPPPAYSSPLLRSLRSPILQRSNTMTSISSMRTFDSSATTLAQQTPTTTMTFSFPPYSPAAGATPTTATFNRSYDSFSTVNSSTPGLSHSADDLRPLQVKSAFSNFYRSFNFSPSPFPHKFLLFEFPNGTSVRIPWTAQYKDTMRSLWELVSVPVPSSSPPGTPTNEKSPQEVKEPERIGKFSAAATALSYSGLPKDVLGNIWEYSLSFVKPGRTSAGDGYLSGLEFVVLAWMVGLYCKREQRQQVHQRRGSGSSIQSSQSQSQEDSSRVSIESFASKMMGGPAPR